MRILLVEDEHKIANSIKKGLEQENLVVDIAYDGVSGFDLASTEPYDLFILDRLLPEMSGIEICKKLRELNIHTPILILTARSQTEEKVEGLNAGADDYLAKPFAFSELVARVKALLRRQGNLKNEVFKALDLTLNAQTYEVFRGSKQIFLSSKEFTLLHYFLMHQGKIVTKEQIINHVWNYDANVLPNSVEVYIVHLRNKIDKPFPKSPPLLQTVRGFGYKIVK